MSDYSNAVTRRTFLRNTALGAAGFALLPEAVAHADDKPYGPFRMGIQSYSLRAFRTEEALKMTKGFGLKFWEAYPAHFPITESPKIIGQYKDLLKSYDIRLTNYGVVDFRNNEAEARHTFNFAKLMGIETLSAYPMPDAFGLLDRLVAEYKINIAIHNHGPGDNLYDMIDKGIKAVEGHHIRIGSCTDTGHYLRSDEDPVEAVKRFGKRVYGVHLKDVKGGRGEQKEHTEIGKGKLDTVALLKVLKENKCRGVISLEYEEHENDPGMYIEECLAMTREAIKKV